MVLIGSNSFIQIKFISITSGMCPKFVVLRLQPQKDSRSDMVTGGKHTRIYWILSLICDSFKIVQVFIHRPIIRTKVNTIDPEQMPQ